MGVFTSSKAFRLGLYLTTSLNWYFGDSAYDIDFLNNRAFEAAPSSSYADLLSCSRASSGYAKTSTGTLTSFSSNQLRITDLGLLVEDSRTNTCPKSQTFSTWDSATGLTSVTDNQTTAPDGTTTAAKITENSTGGRHMTFTSCGSHSVGNVLTASAFFKNITRRYVSISFVDGSDGTPWAAVIADLQSGTITETNGTWYNSSQIETFGNGWFRISVTGTLDANYSGVSTLVAVSGSDVASGATWVNGQPSYTANGSEFYVWGAQLEVGAFASSIISTSGASATRAADLVTCIGSLNGIIAANTGSVVVDVKSNNDTTGAYWSIIGDGNAGAFMLRMNSSSTINSYVSPTDLNATLGNSLTFSAGVKVGTSRDGSGRSIVGGAGSVSTDSLHSGISGAIVGKDVFYTSYAYFRRLTVWNSRLADATLQNMTDPATTDYSSATIDINFATGAIRKTPTIYDFTTTTRASTGYSKTSAGALVNFPINAPRITDLGLLIEGAATNVALQSADFSDANWTKTNLTVTTNQAAAPTGATEMDDLDDAAATTTTHSVNQNPSGFTAGRPVAFSVFLKDVDRRYVQLMIQGHSSTGKVWAYFDLQSGTVTDSGRVIGTGTEIGMCYIESFANSVYRCSITGLVNTSDTQVDCYLSLADRGTQAGGTTSNDRPSYTGSSKSVLAWGAQIEDAQVSLQNTGNCSSYIPTAGSTAIRAADDVHMIGSLLDAMSYPDMSFIADYHAPAMDISGQDWARDGGIVGGLAGNYDTISFGSFGLQASNDSVDLNFSFPGARADGDDPHRVGYSRDPSGRSLVADGGTLVSDADPNIRTKFTYGGIGRGQQGKTGCFYLRRFLIWKSRLDNTTLTSYSNQANTSFPGAVFDIDFTAGPTITKSPLPADYLSCSRASIGYAKKSDGTLAYFENNMLRQTDLGLLVEDSRTNLSANSTFSASSGLTSITDNATTAPNGRPTAQLLIEDTVAGGSKRAIANCSGVAGSLPYTFSIYAKAKERSFIQLQMSDNATGDCCVAFNLSTGAVLTVSGSPSGSWTNVSGTSEVLGNGWVRCTITATKGSSTDHYLYVFLANSQATATAGMGCAYNGDGTSGLYVWGLQLEQASFASSHIPTAGATVARAADAVTMIGGVAAVQTGSAWSVIASLAATPGVPTFSNYVRIIGGTGGGNIAPLFIDQGSATIGSYNGSAALAGDNFNKNNAFKAGASNLAGTGRSVVVNAGTVASDANYISTWTDVPTIGYSAINNIWFGYFNRVTLWNSRLADATLQSRTAP